MFVVLSQEMIRHSGQQFDDSPPFERPRAKGRVTESGMTVTSNGMHARHNSSRMRWAVCTAHL
jgi:hypothetical protein